MLGNFFAFDAKTGDLLKRIDAGGALNSGLISYAVDGQQYVAAAVGGITVNSAGVAGPLKVSVFSLSAGDTKVLKLERLPTQGAGDEETSSCLPEFAAADAIRERERWELSIFDGLS